MACIILPAVWHNWPSLSSTSTGINIGISTSSIRNNNTSLLGLGSITTISTIRISTSSSTGWNNDYALT
jgi:hypothetical protein